MNWFFAVCFTPGNDGEAESYSASHPNMRGVSAFSGASKSSNAFRRMTIAEIVANGYCPRFGRARVRP